MMFLPIKSLQTVLFHQLKMNSESKSSNRFILPIKKLLLRIKLCTSYLHSNVSYNFFKKIYIF